MKNNEKASTSTADLQKDIENRIRKFMTNPHAKFNTELPNDWRLDLVHYEIDDKPMVDVMIDNGSWDNCITVTIKDDSDIEKAAYGAAYVATEITTPDMAKKFEAFLRMKIN